MRHQYAYSFSRMLALSLEQGGDPANEAVASAAVSPAMEVSGGASITE